MGCSICEQRFQGHDFNSINMNGARMAFRGKVTGIYPASQAPYMRPFSRYSTVTIKPRKGSKIDCKFESEQDLARWPFWVGRWVTVEGCCHMVDGWRR